MNDETAALTCANHPDRSTMLRCNRCNKPICVECAVLTPVGYRCRECVRGQQDKFYTATTVDRVLAYGAALASGLVLGLAVLVGASFLRFGFFAWLIAFFLGSAAGGGLAELVWMAARRRRSRHFAVIVTALFLVAAAPLALLSGVWITAAVFVGAAASALYARSRVRS
ncbi:MAG: hypothetical protein N2383_07425 [Caldilineales bacterium]|nr:hypothetical protein [Caldilineales bacterium]